MASDSELSIPAGATGIGSMPGTSVIEATAVIAGELPDLPHLPELPARGPGSDMIGRSAALLAAQWSDFGIDTTPTGWRLSGSETAPMRRALSWLGEDLDRAEEVFGDSEGAFKVQLCGPWTLVAQIEGLRGGPALRDAGLVADVVAGLVVTAAEHVAQVRRRLPNRQVVLQLDEPLLPAVVSGAIQSASGFTSLPEVPAAEAATALQRIVEAVDVPVILHCCAQYPFEVAAAAGVAGVSWDLALTPHPVDPVAAAFEAGTQLIIGAVPTMAAIDRDVAWGRVAELWRRAGFAETELARVTFSPSCGLAGAPDGTGRAALSTTNALAARAEGGVA